MDIVFNDDYTWCIGENEDELDVQSVATHEAGHWIRLVDLYYQDNDEMTMYFEVPYNDITRRTLAWGDIAGVRCARWLVPIFMRCNIVSAG